MFEPHFFMLIPQAEYTRLKVKKPFWSRGLGAFKKGIYSCLHSSAHGELSLPEIKGPYCCGYKKIYIQKLNMGGEDDYFDVIFMTG